MNDTKREALENNIFGKRILITDHNHWTVADVVAGYRSQSEIEFGFRQLKNPHEVSFSPMYHWTDKDIAVHTFTCVLALQLAYLLRLKAHRAGHDLSVKALLDTLGGIQETVDCAPHRWRMSSKRWPGAGASTCGPPGDPSRGIRTWPRRGA